jgi:hypothetical protein
MLEAKQKSTQFHSRPYCSRKDHAMLGEDKFVLVEEIHKESTKRMPNFWTLGRELGLYLVCFFVFLETARSFRYLNFIIPGRDLVDDFKHLLNPRMILHVQAMLEVCRLNAVLTLVDYLPPRILRYAHPIIRCLMIVALVVRDYRGQRKWRMHLIARLLPVGQALDEALVDTLHLAHGIFWGINLMIVLHASTLRRSLTMRLTPTSHSLGPLSEPLTINLTED